MDALSMPIGIGELTVTVDGVSMEALFRSDGRRLVGALTVFIGDAGEAEDIAQEAFARVFASRSRIIQPDRAVNYLYSTAFNLARSRGRRRARFDRIKIRLGVAEASQPADAGVLQSESTVAVTAAVGALPPQQRSCVILHYFSDMSVNEVADVLGISPNSVKTHLRRAFATLRGLLRGEDLL